jgi:hypothetical protein
MIHVPISLELQAVSIAVEQAAVMFCGTQHVAPRTRARTTGSVKFLSSGA